MNYRLSILSLLLVSLPVIAQEGTAPPADRETLVQSDVAGSVTALTDKDPLRAEMARRELADLGRPAVPALVAAMSGDDAERRYILADLLGEIRDPGGVPALLPLLESRETHTESVASAAARALGRIGDPSAIPALIRALETTDPELRFEAAHALGTLRAVSAGKALLRLLEDQGTTLYEYQVRCAATEALGRLRYRPAVEKLRTLLDVKDKERGSDLEVRTYALRALERISGESKGDPFGMDEAARNAVYQAWKTWCDGQIKEAEAVPSEEPPPPPPATPEEPAAPEPPAPPSDEGA